jgi:hypothetical protein
MVGVQPEGLFDHVPGELTHRQLHRQTALVDVPDPAVVVVGRAERSFIPYGFWLRRTTTMGVPPVMGR